MQEIQMPEGALKIDQLQDEINGISLDTAAQQLNPKEIKQIQRAARRFGRRELVSQSRFTRKQVCTDKRKRLQKLKKAARRKNR